MQSQVLEFLSLHNQTNILSIIDTLSGEDKAAFLDEVQKYQKIYQGGPQVEELKCPLPLENCEKVNLKNYKLSGLESIKKQELACMVFAAGEGSRLGFNRAKGLFCIEKKNSLFSHLCRWILAYEIAFGIKIPLLILVSLKNKKEIQSHFEQNKFFKLDPSRVIFIEQDNYPFFDNNHQWILKDDNTIANAPNGNGAFFDVLQKNNIINALKQQNIKYLQVFFIDNPLIDPLDPDLVGFLIEKKLNAAIHVFERDDANEKVGVICKDNDRHFVVDYMQMSTSTFTKIQNENLFFPYANSGHFCVSVDSLIALIDKKIKLPYHWVWKKTHAKVYGWKAEKFAFDIFIHLNCGSLCYDKKLTFAPLKTLQDAENVYELLNQKNQNIYQSVYGESLLPNCSLKIEDIVSYLEKH